MELVDFQRSLSLDVYMIQRDAHCLEKEGLYFCIPLSFYRDLIYKIFFINRACVNLRNVTQPGLDLDGQLCIVKAVNIFM